MRANTERPITVACGTNTLVGRDMGRLRALAAQALAGTNGHAQAPPLWDGHAAGRIARVVVASMAGPA